MSATIHHGDCRDVMRAMEAESFHAIVSDPPYELSDGAQASPARIAAKVLLPQNAHLKPERSRELGLDDLAFEIARLCGVARLPRPSAAMPVVAVAFDDQAARGDDDVEDAAPAPGGRISYRDAAVHSVPKLAQYAGSFELECADAEAFVDALHRMGACFLSGGIGVGLRVASSGFPRLATSGAVIDDSNAVVCALHDALAARVSASNGAEDISVPRLSASGGSINLLTARAAATLLTTLQLAGAELVRAGAPTGCLSPEPQPDFVRYVAVSAYGAIAFDLRTHSKKISAKGFMGKEWDGSKVAFDPSIWREALRVLKPGGYLVAFGGARTYHRMACAIEDSGFELRDCGMFLYGSGFPKSHDIGKAIDRAAGAEREVVGKSNRHVSGKPDQSTGGLCGSATFAESVGMGSFVTAPATDAAREWDGYGTALKPAFEPIILARKPFRGTVAANVLAHGCGALNIDGCRVEGGARPLLDATARITPSQFGAMGGSVACGETTLGRWPANLLLGCACEHEHDPECAVALLDAQSGERSAGSDVSGAEPSRTGESGVYGEYDRVPWRSHGDAGGASRFFFTAKASRSEREAGLDHRVRRVVNDGRQKPIDNAYQRAETQRANVHPTVKPVSLMRWLVRLVGGKRGSRILDPFCGSGTTGIACVLEGFDFDGIDLEAEHCDIARGRILAAHEEAGTASAAELETVPERTGPVQLGLLGGDGE